MSPLALVVDDKERQREVATGILTRLGHNAKSESNGEERIEYVKETPVDLIVLDMVTISQERWHNGVKSPFQPNRRMFTLGMQKWGSALKRR